MIVRRAALRVAVSAAFPVVGCMQILDIDGDYRLHEASGAAGEMVGPPAADAAGSGGTPPRFDAGADATGSGGGGDSSTDGKPPMAVEAGADAGADAWRPADSGSDAASDGEPTPRCAAGRFRGAFLGTVVPNIVSQYQVSGNITLSLEASGEGPAARLEGELSGGGQQSSFDAMLEGTLDCATGQLEGTIESGVALLDGNPWYEFEGTILGILDASGILQGEWHTVEVPPTALFNHGDGIWSAAPIDP